MKKLFLWLFVAGLIGSCGVKKSPEPELTAKADIQTEGKYIARTIAFYNLENFFDTINDPKTRDDDFTPDGRDAWTSERYWHKVKNMSQVISMIGKKYTHMPPAAIGVAEVENRSVLEDLVNAPALRPYHYGIVHFDSPDHRGIDVALLYMKGVFKPVNYKKFPLLIYNSEGRRIYTRDVLLVTGMMDGERIHIIVNHWPSRRGGEARSRPLRMKAAELDMKIVDSLYKADPNAKIVMMGDLNDDPDSPSIKEVLHAKGKKSAVGKHGLYAAMEHFYRAGIGTLAYRDSWNLFDQIFLSYPLVKDKTYKTFELWKTGIFNKTFLTQRKGAFKGYPLRTFAGGQYLGGYSDHFPVYVILLKKK